MMSMSTGMVPPTGRCIEGYGYVKNGALLQQVQSQGNCEEVNLSFHSLEWVPTKWIHEFCSQVPTLDLSFNKLTSIPDDFPILLRHLVKLSMNSNRLQRLPEDIGYLEKLEYLDISHNQIRILPVSMGKLVRLQFLDVTGNPLNTSFASFKHLEDLRHVKVGSRCPAIIKYLAVGNTLITSSFNDFEMKTVVDEPKCQLFPIMTYSPLNTEYNASKKGADLSKQEPAGNLRICMKRKKMAKKNKRFQSTVDPKNVFAHLLNSEAGLTKGPVQPGWKGLVPRIMKWILLTVAISLISGFLVGLCWDDDDLEEAFESYPCLNRVWSTLRPWYLFMKHTMEFFKDEEEPELAHYEQVESKWKLVSNYFGALPQYFNME